ncbi:MAG: C4-dicarboxylate transporter permease [Acidobacteria bacterium]|nr:C4-dicarboxylate transporter permease [Acidobacteriota bacterium]
MPSTKTSEPPPGTPQAPPPAAAPPSFRQRLVAFMGSVNPLVVLFFLCVVFSLLTFVIPGGAFDRRTLEVMGHARSIVVPGSFHYVPAIPQGFPQLWTVFMRGALEGADRSFVIMLSAGAMTAVIATGAIDAGIHLLVRRTGRWGIAFIPIIIFALGTCGATFGMYEEAIPFILVIAPLMLTMGFDSMSAVFVMYWSIAVGFACGITNPYTVAIGQALAGVPLYSGSGFRLVCFVVMMSVMSAVVIRYVLRVKRDPSRSLSAAEDEENRRRLRASPNASTAAPMTLRRTLALLVLLGTFVILIVGLLKYGWGFTEIGGLYFWMGIVVPLVGGLSVSEMIEKNIEGWRSVVIAVIMMSAAQILYFILQDSRILDTILNYFASYLGRVPQFVIAYVMFGISALAAALLGSASGTAATVMPILAPLADVLHFSKQIVVLAFQMASGAFNFWMPWDGIAFTICSMAGVNFFRYIKASALFAVLVYTPVALILLLVAVEIGYR